MGDLPQCGLCTAPCQAAGRGGVETVFEHIEVERTQIFGAVNLQLGHHGMKLIDLVMGQDFSLQRSGAAHGVAVDLQHLR